MQTVPQPRPARTPLPTWPALTAAMERARTAQCKAIFAWHQRDGMSDLDAAIAQHPHYPLIACSDSPSHFAPVRGTPRPAA